MEERAGEHRPLWVVRFSRAGWWYSWPGFKVSGSETTLISGAEVLERRGLMLGDYVRLDQSFGPFGGVFTLHRDKDTGRVTVARTPFGAWLRGTRLTSRLLGPVHKPVNPIDLPEELQDHGRGGAHRLLLPSGLDIQAANQLRRKQKNALT
jgi:hypothetical protein